MFKRVALVLFLSSASLSSLCGQTSSNVAGNSAYRYALVAEGESVPSGATLPTTGDLLNLGSVFYPKADPPLPPFNAGANGNMDFLSRLAKQPQWSDPVSVNNLAVGGTKCAEMEEFYTKNRVALYAPGAEEGPNPVGTTVFDFIWTGKNDSDSDTDLSSFESCMLNHLDEITAAGFNPVVMTMYLGYNAQTASAIALLKSYNDFELTLEGKSINGKTIEVIDIAKQFPPEPEDADFEQPVNVEDATFTAHSYRVEQSGALPNATSTITFILDAESPGLTTYLSRYPALMIGGYNTSTVLNYQRATFVSISGSAVTAKLAVPLASTPLVGEKGYFWPSAIVASLHMGPVGYEKVAQYISTVFNFSCLKPLDDTGQISSTFVRCQQPRR